ncbi:hypothetical protein [Thalassospira povalilytica]|uniref:hypothetical protein n=1 Tax=Thalassospira povalilytica TaxID=732237 RepID=UPI003AA893BD
MSTKKTIKKRKFTRLIMLSGGIDSAFLLSYFLRETEDTILVHHVNLINQERRHRAEAQACEKIVAYCRKEYRDFLYSESTVDRSGFQAMGYDVITVAAEGGIAASNYYLKTGKMPDFWMLGLNEEEVEILGQATAEQPYTDGKPTVAEQPASSRLNYILAAIAASCFPNAPPKYLRPITRSKRELMDYMGANLVNLCWTCRRPIETPQGFQECGICQTCELMKAI